MWGCPEMYTRGWRIGPGVSRDGPGTVKGVQAMLLGDQECAQRLSLGFKEFGVVKVQYE